MAGPPVIRVFAVGSPRSGTTLLQRLLAERIGLATLRETFLVPRVHSPARPLRRLGVARRGAVSAAAEAIGRPIGPVPLHDRRRTVGVVRAVATSLDGLATAADAPGWVEKTPRHLWHVAVLTAACQPRFLHIVRDGADVAVSVVSVTERHPERWAGPRSARTAIERWAADVDQHRRWADHPNHAFVRYDDLVDDPDRLMAAVASWLGLPGLVERSVAPGEIAFASEPWKLAALGEVSSATTSTTGDRVAAAQALRDDPEVGPILEAATLLAAELPYERLLGPPPGPSSAMG